MANGNKDKVSENIKTEATMKPKAKNMENNLIPPMDFSESKCKQAAWEEFKLDFEILLKASDLEEESEDRKVAVLLLNIGRGGRNVFKSFGVTLNDITLKDLIVRFDSHFTKKKNTTMERYNFLSHMQGEQSITEYITSLKNLSFSCGFVAMREELVRSKFICGLSTQHNDIKERLLTEGDITLEKTIEMAVVMEESKKSVVKMETETVFAGKAATSSYTLKEDEEVKIAKYRQSNNERNYNWKSKRPAPMYGRKHRSLGCEKCGMVHQFKCPAKGQQCNYCGEMDHFSRRCPARIRRQMNQAQEIFSDDEEEDGHLFFGQLRVYSAGGKSGKPRWNVLVATNQRKFSCQLDTGADTNVMSAKDFFNFGYKRQMLTPNKSRIVGLGGYEVPVLGMAHIKIEHNNQQYDLDFHIMDGETHGILGLEAIIQMNLLERKDSCKANFNKEKYYKFNVNNLTSNLFVKNEDLFQGLGCLKGKCHLNLKEDARPTIDSPRRVPFNLLEPLRVELEKMASLGVIKVVDEPTEWVNSIVLVKKSNGSLRICLDPRNLNKAIKRSHYQFPTIHNIKARLAGAKIFSSLDASSGFWTVSLDEESSKLCTFITPFGRYRFLRLPFGICSAPEYFHSTMNKIFQGIDNVIIYIDDILIFGKDKSEHDKALEQVLNTARKAGLKFNKTKTNLYQKEIKFMGHRFTEKGQKPDDEKIAAIVNMARPESVGDLQRFLGMVNYLGAYIKNLASNTIHLRELLKKEILWHWDSRHESEFKNLKELITKAPVLTYYDQNKVLTLTVDASKSGIGCALCHNSNPIAYASATLTNCQQNYAQIEKELFAILVGCTKFHQYIYGQRIIVETDHRPLVPLFTKPLYSVPARLQRFMMRLQAYDLEVRYKPGKQMFLADTLSRAALPNNVLEEIDEDLKLHCNLVLSNINIDQDSLELIKKAAEADKAITIVRDYVKNGWPNNKKLINSVAQPYYNIRQDLHEIDGILLKLDRLVIPAKIRRQILGYLHEGHFGINRTQQLARTCVYWPNMNNDIENVVNSCKPCQEYMKNKSREPLKPHDIVDLPWFKVGMDLFEHDKKNYLLIVDYYSKFVEIGHLHRNTTAKEVIVLAKSIFARHGIPKIVVADNGPQFFSAEFKKFSEDWNFNFNPSDPYLPNSNGLAERNVQTIKDMLDKCKESNSDPYIALLNFRTTPNSLGTSPSQLLMSRLLRTKLPILYKKLRPELIDVASHNKAITKKQQQMCENYNKISKNSPEFETDQNVYFKKDPQGKWTLGKIDRKLSLPRSYMVEDRNGARYRRNSKHIRADKSTNISDTEQACDNSSVNDPNSDNGGENGSPISSEVNDEVVVSDEQGYMTRSGRISRPVEKFDPSVKTVVSCNQQASKSRLVKISSLKNTVLKNSTAKTQPRKRILKSR